MDNILKMLLGVLGVAGLIAMAVPTNMAVTPEAAPPPAAAELIPPPAPAVSGEGLPPEQQAEESFGDEFMIGEPTIDGNPIGYADQQQSNDQPQQAQNGAMQSYDPATYGTNFNYAVPGMENYAAMPNYGQPMPDASINPPAASGQ